MLVVPYGIRHLNNNVVKWELYSTYLITILRIFIIIIIILISIIKDGQDRQRDNQPDKNREKIIVKNMPLLQRLPPQTL